MLATWTTISTDTSAPYAASFDTTAVADGLYDLRAIATDAAGNQTTSALATDRRVDNTAPDLTFTGPADGDRVWGSLPLAASASDAGTGLAWVKFRAGSGAGAWTTWAMQTTGPFTYTWDSTSVSDGPAQIQVLASDALGNEAQSALGDRRQRRTDRLDHGTRQRNHVLYRAVHLPASASDARFRPRLDHLPAARARWLLVDGPRRDRA